MQTSYEVIVIGAGSMGMSAGAHVAKRGVKTLLIDAYDPPHRYGSHHGETRLMRHAYSGGETYVAMALRAHELWNELEQETGKKLLIQSGVLNMMPTGHNNARDKLASTFKFKLDVDVLDAGDISNRWRGITLPEHYIGLYEKNAGYLQSEACIQAYRGVAAAHGAVMMPHTRVIRVDAKESCVSVHTTAGVFHADQIIFSAGAGVGQLKEFRLPVKPIRKTVGWFKADEALFASGRFPGFTIGTSDGDYYGFPSINGSGVKIGRHDTGVHLEPDEHPVDFGVFQEDEQDLRKALETYMPLASGDLLRGAVCKYEMTPDEHFIIDHAPHHPRLHIACGFSGHGFKFASVVGEILADQITKETAGYDLSPFSLSRFQ